MADRQNDDTPGTGRRGEDRRKSQQPFDGPERRKSSRRSGTDRRADSRHEGTIEGE